MDHGDTELLQQRLDVEDREVAVAAIQCPTTPPYDNVARLLQDPAVWEKAIDETLPAPGWTGGGRRISDAALAKISNLSAEMKKKVETYHELLWTSGGAEDKTKQKKQLADYYEKFTKPHRHKESEIKKKFKKGDINQEEFDKLMKDEKARFEKAKADEKQELADLEEELRKEREYQQESARPQPAARQRKRSSHRLPS